MIKAFHSVAGLLLVLVLAGSCADTAKEDSAPTVLPPPDVRLVLVDQARWAMSAHNMQPWRIVLDRADPRRIGIYLADDRLLPATDPYSRQIVMSIGGFLEALREAASARGFSARIAPFPEGAPAGEDGGSSFTRPVANVRIMPATGAAQPGSAHAVSSATVKANLEPADFSLGQDQAYLEANAWKGVSLRFLRDEDSLAQLKPVLREAFRLEMQHEPTLLESYRLMRRNRRQIAERPWGLSYGSNYPEKSLRLIELFETLFPMEKKKWGLRGADNFDREVDKAAVFLIIVTDGNNRLLQLQAGMLFQRLWRIALRDGYAMVPASQPLQEYQAMAEHYRRIHRSFASPGQTIQMIAWLGRPDPGYRPGFRIPAVKLLSPE